MKNRGECLNAMISGLRELAVDIRKTDFCTNDPQLMSRDFFIHLEHSVLGRTISDSTPIRFKDNPNIHWKAAPLLGEDNRYVFMELLGFKEDDLSLYIERGIIV